MGINYESVPVKNHSEVVHPGHPGIIDTALLADKTAKLKAGTIKLKAGTILKADAGGKLEAAAPDDTPIAVLAADSDGKNAEALVLWHGMVVAGRLLDSSGAQPVAAAAAMTVKLRGAGIYPTQLFTSAKKG